MNLRCQYLGLELEHPLMPGASPLVDDLDAVRRLEDAGASAIVMHSLFEEQLAGQQLASYRTIDVHTDSFAEAATYSARPPGFTLGPEAYLERIRTIKEAVSVPVIASLNGSTAAGWLEHARLMAEAGADALELNLYGVATDPREDAETIETRWLEAVRLCRRTAGIPIAAKLSPFHTSLPHFARRLNAAGADGLILFNRFFVPDIDVEALELRRTHLLSDSTELLLRLRGLAVLSGRVPASLAVSGGVHTAVDAVKAVMCGADAVQLVSVLLRQGPGALACLKDELARWLEEHEYESLEQMRGSMSLLRCPDPRAYERANYVEMLHHWRDDVSGGGR